MKYTDFVLIKYEADEGKVFDWKEPRFHKDKDGNQIQDHLNAKVLFIGGTDKIENYIEVDEDGNITDLVSIEPASSEDYLEALKELGVE